MPKVHCKKCGKDPDEICNVPSKNGGGEITTSMCLECAIAEGLFCEEHSMPHLGFTDGTTACKGCIDTMRIENSNRAEEVLAKLLMGITMDERAEVLQEAEMVAKIWKAPEAMVVVAWISSLAVRMKKGFDETLDLVIKEHRIDLIVPNFMGDIF